MSFLDLLKADTDITNKLSVTELSSIFDYNVFLKHVDDIFKRLNLSQKKATNTTKVDNLAPRTI